MKGQLLKELFDLRIQVLDTHWRLLKNQIIGIAGCPVTGQDPILPISLGLRLEESSRTALYYLSGSLDCYNLTEGDS